MSKEAILKNVDFTELSKNCKTNTKPHNNYDTIYSFQLFTI